MKEAAPKGAAAESSPKNSAAASQPRDAAPPPTNTIERLAHYLTPALWLAPETPRWPPDVFALVTAILAQSGAYKRVVKDWPPSLASRAGGWTKSIADIGSEWRQAYISNKPLPSEVVEWWQMLRTHGGVAVADVESDRSLCEAILQLCAAADESCAGVGLPTGEEPDDVEKVARSQLRAKSTLCKDVDRAIVRVLPKLHTPQTGITIRSMSHHLALCENREIDIKWHQGPGGPDQLSINLLLLPLPSTVQPSQFSAASPRVGGLTNMPDCYGFFDYAIPPLHEPESKVLKLMSRAKEVVGHIDGVVLPELALNSKDEMAVRRVLSISSTIFIAGVGDAGKGTEPGRNYVVFNVPLSPQFHVSYEQDKHHRWILDKRQVVQYGLGSRLHATCGWWEHARLDQRVLQFVALKPWLTTCVLICEDLARPDPAAEIVRAVGPNLVIALLMDGPQLAARWPSRYAAVLADDPGCSVLTLTSEGMSRLSRPGPGVPNRAPVVALWKDAKSGGPVEVELPPNAEALILCLSVEYHEEWTADGRGDRRTSGYPVLVGIHPLIKS